MCQVGVCWLDWSLSSSVASKDSAELMSESRWQGLWECLRVRCQHIYISVWTVICHRIPFWEYALPISGSLGVYTTDLLATLCVLVFPYSEEWSPLLREVIKLWILTSQELELCVEEMSPHTAGQGQSLDPLDFSTLGKSFGALGRKHTALIKMGSFLKWLFFLRAWKSF